MTENAGPIGTVFFHILSTAILMHTHILFQHALLINVTILILKLSIPDFQIVIFLALHPIEFRFLNSSD